MLWPSGTLTSHTVYRHRMQLGAAQALGVIAISSNEIPLDTQRDAQSKTQACIEQHAVAAAALPPGGTGATHMAALDII